MVNNNIQGVIPIAGKGFTVKRNGDYLPGEFKRLSNVEIEDGILKNRRSIQSSHGKSTDVVITQQDNPFGFIGSLKQYSILVNETKQTAFNTASPVEMWAPTLLTTPAETGSFHKIIGYFRYNNKNYWLTLEFRAGIHIKIKLFHGDISLTNDSPSSYNAAYFATLTETDLITVLGTSGDYPKFAYRNFFMQGNRLWIVTSVGVFFTKATDPTVSAVPDGGFFKFPDENITWGMALRNVIYALCDNSIHAISYSTDPNTDAVVQVISDNMGADRGVIYKDTPVVVNQLGIFSITNGYVEEIVENEFDVGLDYYTNSLAAFGDYLILCKTVPVNYEKAAGESTLGRTNLVANPSFETNLTGYGVGTAFMERTRSADRFFGSGGWSVKIKKINDKTVPTRGNLIKTPSFDTGAYSPFWAASTNADLATSNTVFYDGTHSLRWKAPAGSTNVYSSIKTPDGLAGMVAIAGRTYRFNGRIRKTTDGFDGRNIQASVWWYNGAGAVIATSALIDVEPSAAGVWEEIEFEEVAPVGAAYSQLRFFTDLGPVASNADWIIRFDTLVWEDITPVIIGGYDNPKYFDGDTADTAQYLYSWNGAAEAGSSLRYGDDGPIADALKLLDHTANITVTPNKSYTFGGAFYPDSHTRGIDLVVRQYTAANALISETVIYIGEAIEDAWTYLDGEIIMAANCDHVQFAFFAVEALGETLDYGEIIYIDSLICELTETYGAYFDGDAVDTPAITYAWTGAANASTSTATYSNIPRKLFKNGSLFTPGLEGNSLGYNLYFLNMENGSVHVVEFCDGRDVATPGRVVEVFVNTNKNANGNYKCMFLTNRYVSESSSSVTTKGNVYYMNSYRDIEFEDYAAKSDGQLKRYEPKVDIEIDSYVPDGSEYLVKKFRNLEVMGKVPYFDFDVRFGYDNAEYADPIDISNPDERLRPHDPARVGINQRARALSVRFTNDDSNVPLNGADYGVLEISDLRTLWHYTGRSPERKFADAT